MAVAVLTPSMLAEHTSGVGRPAVIAVHGCPEPALRVVGSPPITPPSFWSTTTQFCRLAPPPAAFPFWMQTLYWTGSPSQPNAVSVVTSTPKSPTSLKMGLPLASTPAATCLSICTSQGSVQSAWQPGVDGSPGSHCSPSLTMPSPQYVQSARQLPDRMGRPGLARALPSHFSAPAGPLIAPSPQ